MGSRDGMGVEGGGTPLLEIRKHDVLPIVVATVTTKEKDPVKSHRVETLLFCRVPRVNSDSVPISCINMYRSSRFIHVWLSENTSKKAIQSDVRSIMDVSYKKSRRTQIMELFNTYLGWFSLPSKFDQVQI